MSNQLFCSKLLCYVLLFCCLGLTVAQQKCKPDYTTFKKTFIQYCVPSGKLKDKEAQLLESLMRDSPFDDTVSFSRYDIQPPIGVQSADGWVEVWRREAISRSWENKLTFSLRFCYVIGWFGPLQNNCQQFFARMKDLTSKSYVSPFSFIS